MSLVVIVFLLPDTLHTKAPTIFWQKFVKIYELIKNANSKKGTIDTPTAHAVDFLIAFSVKKDWNKKKLEVCIKMV